MNELYVFTCDSFFYGELYTILFNLMEVCNMDEKKRKTSGVDVQ